MCSINGKIGFLVKNRKKIKKQRATLRGLFTKINKNICSGNIDEIKAKLHSLNSKLEQNSTYHEELIKQRCYLRTEHTKLKNTELILQEDILEEVQEVQEVQEVHEEYNILEEIQNYNYNVNTDFNTQRLLNNNIFRFVNYLCFF